MKNMQKKVGKFLSKMTWEILYKLPDSWCGHLMRKAYSVALPEGKYKKIIFKRAQTREEYQAAFQLVNDAYIETGLSSLSEDELKISKYMALPTTIVFIAVYEGKVIGTVSQIMKTSLGLPIENFTDISLLKNTGRSISELSALAVHKDWRSNRVGLFFPLVLYAYKFCREVIETDYIVMVLRQKSMYFMKHIMNFEVLSDSKVYQEVNNHQSSALYAYIPDHYERTSKIYKDAPFQKNIPKLMVNFPWLDQCDFSKNVYSTCIYHFMTPEDLRYFFNDKSCVLNSLSDHDKKLIVQAYHFKMYQEHLPDFKKHNSYIRSSIRVPAKMKMYKFNGERVGDIYEVSEFGFSIVCKMFETNQDIITGKIEVREGVLCQFKAIKKWEYNNRAGYQLVEINSQIWNDLFQEVFSHVSSPDYIRENVG